MNCLTVASGASCSTMICKVVFVVLTQQRLGYYRIPNAYGRGLMRFTIQARERRRFGMEREKNRALKPGGREEVNDRRGSATMYLT